MSNRVGSARWCWDIGFSSRNRNTHGQAYSLGTSLTFKIMVKKVKVFILSRGALNKRMIDLAEQAGAEFFFEQKIWDVTLSIYFGETEGELGKKK
jgi:flavin-dependent dehydrogenase